MRSAGRRGGRLSGPCPPAGFGTLGARVVTAVRGELTRRRFARRSRGTPAARRHPRAPRRSSATATNLLESGRDCPKLVHARAESAVALGVAMLRLLGAAQARCVDTPPIRGTGGCLRHRDARRRSALLPASWRAVRRRGRRGAQRRSAAAEVSGPLRGRRRMTCLRRRARGTPGILASERAPRRGFRAASPTAWDPLSRNQRATAAVLHSSTLRANYDINSSTPQRNTGACRLREGNGTLQCNDSWVF
jgi:hypothetical protein